MNTRSWLLTALGVVAVGAGAVTVYNQTRISADVIVTSSAKNAITIPFDEPPQSTAFYSTDGQRLGTCTSGCPTTGIAGASGKAVQFDGVSQYLNLGQQSITVPTVNNDASFTVGLWLHLDTVPTKPAMIIGNANGTPKGDGALLWVNNQKLTASISDGVKEYSTSVDLTTPANSNRTGTYNFTNSWSYVTVSYSSAMKSLSMTVNGQKAGEVKNIAIKPNVSTQPLTIGQNGGRAFYFKGAVDEVTIWRHQALDLASIQSIINRSKELSSDVNDSRITLLGQTDVARQGFQKVSGLQGYQDPQKNLAAAYSVTTPPIGSTVMPLGSSLGYKSALTVDGNTWFKVTLAGLMTNDQRYMFDVTPNDKGGWDTLQAAGLLKPYYRDATHSQVDGLLLKPGVTVKLSSWQPMSAILGRGVIDELKLTIEYGQGLTTVYECSDGTVLDGKPCANQSFDIRQDLAAVPVMPISINALVSPILDDLRTPTSASLSPFGIVKVTPSNGTAIGRTMQKIVIDAATPNISDTGIYRSLKQSPVKYFRAYLMAADGQLFDDKYTGWLMPAYQTSRGNDFLFVPADATDFVYIDLLRMTYNQTKVLSAANASKIGSVVIEFTRGNFVNRVTYPVAAK